jgi:Ser/Thr protein kinase RdoA (MazF antagonist)
MVRALGWAMGTFHGLTQNSKGAGWIDAEGAARGEPLQGMFQRWHEYVYLNLGEHMRYAKEHGAITGEEERLIRSIFRETRDAIVHIEASTFLHGDLGSHNVFIRGVGVPPALTVIDWEDAILGDPVFDIAMAASFHRMDEFLEDLWRGYRSARELQDDTVSLRFWLYYLRIVIAKSVLRFKLGYDRLNKSVSTPKIRRAVKELAEIM